MLDHKLYIDSAKKDLDKAIANLQTSADESGNSLTKAIIRNLQNYRDMFDAGHEFYPVVAQDSGMSLGDILRQAFEMPSNNS